MDITSDIKMGIQEKKSASAFQNDVNDDTTEDEDDEDSDLDSIMYESTNSVIVIGNHDVYQKADSYLSYFAQKTSMLLSKKRTGLASNKHSSDQSLSDEEKKERTRRSRRFTSKLLNWFSDYADLRNEKLNGLDFYTYFNIYELISGTFICDMYIDKVGIDSIKSLVETKANYLMNRLIPNIDYQVQQSYQYTYLKKEIALLCIECFFVRNDLPHNIDSFKEELFSLDRIYSNTFIDDLKKLIKEVCSILEIDNYINIINYFDKMFINAPKTDELEKTIIGVFKLDNPAIAISFNDELSQLNIVIDGHKEETSQINLKLLPELFESIVNYMNRYYGDLIKDHYSFKVQINNYTEHISCLTLEWSNENYRKYYQTIEYTNGNKSGPALANIYGD